jgi:predicted transposase YbfD/YdcC
MDFLLAVLREVRDPRSFNARHNCVSMLFVALMATLCGAKTSVEIADFAAAHIDEMSELVDLAHGAPSHDCFSRLFRILAPDELERCLASFCSAFRAALGLGPLKGVVALDGKRMRGAFDRGGKYMPALSISVWDAETRLSIAVKAGEGGNEFAAVLEALKSVDLKRCCVTGDALLCFTPVAEAILAAKGDYALKLKKNNRALHAAAVAAFAQADAQADGPASFETHDRGHDRIEHRKGSVTAPLKSVPAFPGLVQFGRIESARKVGGGKIKQSCSYVAMSTCMSPEEMLRTIRIHWSVENHCHRNLDIVTYEDDARARKNNAPHNLSVIRRMAVDILRAHPDNISLSRKMRRASWSKEYLFELLTHMR